jgi:flagellar biosynthetic protein FlhB
MSEDQSAQERTEQASQKRLREARERGDVPRSRDFTAAAVSVAAIGVLLLTGPGMLTRFTALMRGGLHLDSALLLRGDAMQQQLQALLQMGFAAVLPVFAAALLASLLAPMAIGGFAFSGEALGFKFERLDPIAGIGRIFSLRGTVELLKALLKFLLLGGLTALLLWQAVPLLLLSARMPLQQGIHLALGSIGHALLVLSAGLLLLGAIDVPWQLFDYAKRMRMTREELKDEFKETEGRPEVKQRIRQIQQQMARKRMMQEVPRADVVVTNPTHYAVALRYDDARMRAPRVVAKGADHMAIAIRTLAATHKVPLVEAPPLARALYAHVPLETEIPAALYVAVAELLTYIYQLRRAAANGEPAPDAPRPEVDPELDPLHAKKPR